MHISRATCDYSSSSIRNVDRGDRIKMTQLVEMKFSSEGSIFIEVSDASG